MSKTEYYVAKVVITVREPGGDMPGFLDMLRYDGAVVVAWSRTEAVLRGGSSFTVTIRREHPFTIDRWRSFGLVLRDLADEVIK